ncbi:MAG: hypothetical protein HY936_00530 [Nitrosomonadales bacterium]|nr:hypothetical protein [Nitrosomonadales bacterium]
MKVCPRCNFEIQEEQTKCPNCDVVFAQWVASHAPYPPATRLVNTDFLNMPAKKLTIMALAIWFCSLALTGLVLYSNYQRLPGYEILAMGWLSPLVGNFAWFANIFFLYGVQQLISGKAPIKSSILAALLSLDTFRFDQYLMNEGGATTPVYGYGWGAVFWFFSISILLTAVGTRQLETSVHPDQSTEYGWFRTLSLFFSAVTLGAAGFFAIYDRMMANASETQHLAGIAFKRGKICHAPEPNVNEPMHNFSGVLEIVMERNNGSS